MDLLQAAIAYEPGADLVPALVASVRLRCFQLSLHLVAMRYRRLEPVRQAHALRCIFAARRLRAHLCVSAHGRA
eukprot:5001572-Alexandrium_andersonii.AAC.1